MSLRARPPMVSQTGQGYRYVRCKRGGSDDTIYIHQLCAVAGGADPHDVFSDAYDVHHKPLDEVFDLDGQAPPLPLDLPDGTLPPIDTPESVELQAKWEHRTRNLERGVSD